MSSPAEEIGGWNGSSVAVLKMKILLLFCCLALAAASSLAFGRAAMPAHTRSPGPGVMMPATTMPAMTMRGNSWLETGWLVPGIIFDGARSFVSWLELPNHPASLHDSENKGRLRDFDGLFAPQMQQHWQAFAEHPTKHYLKNIGTEWVRLDPQRAYKTLSFLFVAVNGFLLVSCLIVGISIGRGIRRQIPILASKSAARRDLPSG